MTRSKYNAPTSQLFQDLGLLNINQIINYNVLLFMSKFAAKILPPSLMHIFETNSQVHNYNTRHKNDARNIKYTYTDIYHSFLYKGPVLWSNLQNDIKKASITAFPRLLKRHMLQN